MIKLLGLENFSWKTIIDQKLGQVWVSYWVSIGIIFQNIDKNKTISFRWYSLKVSILKVKKRQSKDLFLD